MSKLVVLVIGALAVVYGASVMRVRVGEQDFRASVRDCIGDSASNESIKACVVNKAARHDVKIAPDKIAITMSEPFNASTLGMIIVQKKTVTLNIPFDLKRGLKSKRGTIQVQGDILYKSRVVSPNDPARIKLTE